MHLSGPLVNTLQSLVTDTELFYFATDVPNDPVRRLGRTQDLPIVGETFVPEDFGMHGFKLRSIVIFKLKERASNPGRPSELVFMFYPGDNGEAMIVDLAGATGLNPVALQEEYDWKGIYGMYDELVGNAIGVSSSVGEEYIMDSIWVNPTYQELAQDGLLQYVVTLSRPARGFSIGFDRDKYMPDMPGLTRR